jgi:hypothetical protein
LNHLVIRHIKKDKTCILIDVAILAERNVMQKQQKKIQEFMYRDTTNVVHGTHYLPVIILVTGIVAKGIQKNLEAKPGEHSVDSLQKTIILGTSYVILKVLQSET